MGDDSRKPKCLLDILLKLHIEDQVLDEEGVRQEADTFNGDVSRVDSHNGTTPVTNSQDRYATHVFAEAAKKL
ncbi:hypothetical protein CEXT_338141 [Caerostris extrusa]|uniref:Uncharacterized protein n=1 Tax=Caerostris extrusa TaxID=172846 RepID=A0AAV4VCD6_CAEEX|nr:hypothetical protein CEXT_338141 [Caerostris extrusa]